MAAVISTSYVYVVGDAASYLLMYKNCLLPLYRACPLISPLILPFKNTRDDISNASFTLISLSVSIGMNAIISYSWFNYLVISSSDFSSNLCKPLSSCTASQ